MSALSLIQALIPSAPNAQSGMLSSGQNPTKGQGGGVNPFSALVPGGEGDGGLTVLETAADAGQQIATLSSGTESPPTDLMSLLAGTQITGKKTIDPVISEADVTAMAPALEGELVEEDISTLVDGTGEAADSVVAPGPGTVPGDVATGAALNGASTGNGAAAQSPVSGTASAALQSAAPGDAEAVLKAAAPQTQAGGGAPQQVAAASALQVQGDVLEAGQGAPTAQKLLGIADPKAVADATQKDPAAATLVWGANQKNGTAGANGNNSSQNPFLAAGQNTSTTQPAFHEGQVQTGLPETAEQKLPQAQAVAAQPRFELASQQTAGLDASVTATDTPDGLVVGEQRPPVTVTVRFDQTIHGPQMAAQNLAMHIKRNFANGVNRFEVRLDPPELGRIDVRLDMNADGRVAASLTVDRPETLDLLQRDARLLQKALQDAGINLEDSNLNFSLRDGDGRAAQQENGQSGGTGLDGGSLTDADDESLIEVPEQVAIIENDRIDIRI